MHETSKSFNHFNYNSLKKKTKYFSFSFIPPILQKLTHDCILIIFFYAYLVIIAF